MVSPSEIVWKSKVFLDTNSVPFMYKSEFYKAVPRGAILKPFIMKSVIAGAVKNGFIPETRPAGISLEGFREIYWQKSENFAVPPRYWCWGTLREAARLWLAFSQWLSERRLGLQDAHTQNVVIQGANEPKWCDIGSLVPLYAPALLAVDQFVRSYLYPLLMGQRPGLMRLWRPVAESGIPHVTAKTLELKLPPLSSEPASALIQLREYVDSLDEPQEKGQWTEYYGPGSREAHEQIGQNNRITLLEKIVASLAPSSITDIGANAGLFSRLMARHAEVLSIDPDEGAIERSLAKLRESDRPGNIKLMVASIEESSAAIDAGDIPQADLAVALALSHHLFFTFHQPWKYIAKLLANHTARDLLTEFMPNGLYSLNEPPADAHPAHYTLEAFAEALGIFFESVEIVDHPTDKGDSPRIFLLCRGKRNHPAYDEWKEFPVNLRQTEEMPPAVAQG